MLHYGLLLYGVSVVLLSTVVVKNFASNDCRDNSVQLTPGYVQWSNAALTNDVIIRLTPADYLQQQQQKRTCNSVRTCYNVDDDQPLVKQLIPIEMNPSRRLRLFVLHEKADRLTVDFYGVDWRSFINCSSADGVRFVTQTALSSEANMTSSTVDMPSDFFRHPGSYHFIGIVRKHNGTSVTDYNQTSSTSYYTQYCHDGLRLNVTVRQLNCFSEGLKTDDVTPTEPLNQTNNESGCSGQGYCLTRRYHDIAYRCICCNGWSGDYCSIPSVSSQSAVITVTNSIGDADSSEQTKKLTPTTVTTTADVTNNTKCCSTTDVNVDVPRPRDVTDAITSTVSVVDVIANVTACQLDCRNNGSCLIDGAGMPHCACAKGWSGELCDSPDRIRCSQETCINGICAAASDYIRPSSDGTDGTDIDTEYRCYCIPGFGGERCELSYSACLSGPCLNGGLCLDDLQRGYTCECMEGYYGDNCALVKDINRCQPNPCPHICLDYGQYYVCECNPGFTGERCDEEIDECMSNPCHNGAQCTDTIAGYRCHCTVGFHGLHCEFANSTTSDWSLLLMTSNVGGATRHLHSWTMALCTLIGALLIATSVIMILYCKIHGLYRWSVVCRRHGYSTQTDDVFPSETTRVHSCSPLQSSSAGSRRCGITWSVRSLFHAVVDAVSRHRVVHVDCSATTMTSPKLPLVIDGDLREFPSADASTPASLLSSGRGHRHSKRGRHDVAETAVNIET